MAIYFNEEMSEIITKAMDEKELSIKGLAVGLDITYEAARRIVRGSPPARHVLRTLCRTLDLNFTQMDKLSVETQLRRKYGDTYLTATGHNPELEPIEKAWPHLTDEQKKDATAMITGWAKRGKALGARVTTHVQ